MAAVAHDVEPLFAGEVLRREGAVWVREASPSMCPFIRPGDELRLTPADPARIVRGALVASERANRLVVHRVIACDAAGVLTKGDALVAPDPATPWALIVARVVALRRPSGRVVSLDAFPWPLVNRGLGWVAALAGRPAHEASATGARALARRALWKLSRVPFHLAGLVLR